MLPEDYCRRIMVSRWCRAVPIQGEPISETAVVVRITLAESITAITRRGRGGSIKPQDAATAVADFPVDFARNSASASRAGVGYPFRTKGQTAGSPGIASKKRRPRFSPHTSLRSPGRGLPGAPHPPPRSAGAPSAQEPALNSAQRKPRRKGHASCRQPCPGWQLM
jgi:hypothetical protein